MQANHFKVDQVLGLVTHRLFCDVTAEVSDWRVVTLQERFIKQIIDQSNSVSEVMNNPLLHKFFTTLTKSNEATRCLHYLFRVKCERIDTSFFTVKNLQKTYLRYKELHQELQMLQKVNSEETKQERDNAFTQQRT